VDHFHFDRQGRWRPLRTTQYVQYFFFFRRLFVQTAASVVEKCRPSQVNPPQQGKGCLTLLNQQATNPTHAAVAFRREFESRMPRNEPGLVIRVRGRLTQKRKKARSRPSLARAVFAFFLLCAFGFQSYVTQTHIHFSDSLDAGTTASSEKAGNFSAAKLVSAHKQNKQNVPAKDDPANCPICQQMAVAGAFVTPAASILALPTRTGSSAPPSGVVHLASSQSSHNWQGRAPPVV